MNEHACKGITGRHPDDRVAGHNGQGILTWRCAGCGRHQYRKPVRDYPPEIAPSERGGVAVRREGDLDGLVAGQFIPASWMAWSDELEAMTPAQKKQAVADAIYDHYMGPNPKSFTMPCGLHDRTRCEECRP